MFRLFLTFAASAALVAFAIGAALLQELVENLQDDRAEVGGAS